MDFHHMSAEEVLHELRTERSGLDEKDAQKRLEKYGPNAIETSEKISPFKIFLEQFTSPLVIILIFAAMASYGIGLLPGQESGTIDSLLILAIVFANSIFGFVQDYKAERSIEELRKMSAPSAVVFRNGNPQKIKAQSLVPGDIISIEEGSVIPADCRIISSDDVEIDESILTGESAGVGKGPSAVKKETPLAERKSMAWMNTLVLRGSGKAVVTATGLETEVGKIATQIKKSEKPMTPFQIEVANLGRKIGLGVLGIIFLIAAVHLILRPGDILMTFLVSISLAVAAIPEGLPAVVTLALAIGTKKMSSKNALVRKLPIVESLGSIDIICTDKTGTLTENRMTVRKIYFDGKKFDVSGSGYSTEGHFSVSGKKADAAVLGKILEAGAFCNNASMETGSGKIISGDPTEAALLIAAKKAGAEFPGKSAHKMGEISFSSERKRMTTVFRTEKKYAAYMKGAPEVVLNRCSRIYEKGKTSKLTEKRKKEILKINEQYAGNSLRVLGFASREFPTKPVIEDKIESDMVFLGLQAMEDPPKDGVKKSIAECRKAGIRTVMITGDNIETAKAIARQIGMGTNAAEGHEIENVSDSEMEVLAENVDIFARVSPEHKVKVLKALQRKGHRVAITGDGVNDAPALKSSNVGVSMGLRGSDVAKEASDMILLDDNFSTIVSAIKEGRTIFENIRKFVIYLLTCNLAEVLVVFVLSLFGYLAVTPVQLLWINLMTDGAPAVAIAADPSNSGIMKKKPREKDGGILDERITKLIIYTGVSMTAILLAVFLIGLNLSLATAQSMVFTGFVLYEFVRIASIRQEEELKWNSNAYLLLAIAASFMLQMVVVYSPLNSVFGVVPLGAFEWAVLIAGMIAGWFASAAISKAVLKGGL